MYALTVWQPWAWLLSAGFKLVENRDWVPSWKVLKEGDDLAIHSAAREPSRTDLQEARMRARVYGGITWPSAESTELGRTYGRNRIVAVARFAGIAHRREDLPERQRVWWVGKYGWRLENVRQLDLGSAPKCLGQQGLWMLPGNVEQHVHGQLEAHNEGQRWRKTA